jgi:exonuclease VII large subunit
VLSRGYALVFDAEGKLVREADAASDGSVITTRFAHSSLTSQVIERKSDTSKL